MSATTTRKLRKVLVVNRGEIAVRVIRGLRDRGIRAAVVHSTVDRAELPVQLADEAYLIGDAPAATASYLKAADIVELASRIGADAVHPGYGFLSENAGFARLCRDAGIVFIGPTPEAIAAMGSKIESRRLAIEKGVPVVPGGDQPLPDLPSAERAAAAMGYPVMLKAAAGGGGKGMRMVAAPADLPSAFRAARSEALASFGDDAVYVEKFLVRPRHVEIQVLGDEHGNVISLGERECSLQRRHQKVVEEAPSPVLTPELRRAMGTSAVKAAAAVRYVGAGTVEFLLDPDGRFYFLEMNTRLQVEHPVTELVTGIDLVSGTAPDRRGRAARARVVRRRAARPCHRGPRLRRGPVPRLRAVARSDHAAATAGRSRRAQRLRRARGLPGDHLLRPHAGQAHRVGPRSRAGDAPARPRARGAARRGHSHHGAALSRAARRRGLSRRPPRHRDARPQARSRRAASRDSRRPTTARRRSPPSPPRSST